MLCIEAVSSFLDACSIIVLCSTNCVRAVICSLVVYELISQVRPALDKTWATLYTVVLVLYPLHWFFTFLDSLLWHHLLWCFLHFWCSQRRTIHLVQWYWVSFYWFLTVLENYVLGCLPSLNEKHVCSKVLCN